MTVIDDGVDDRVDAYHCQPDSTGPETHSDARAGSARGKTL